MEKMQCDPQPIQSTNTIQNLKWKSSAVDISVDMIWHHWIYFLPLPVGIEGLPEPPRSSDIQVVYRERACTLSISLTVNPRSSAATGGLNMCVSLD